MTPNGKIDKKALPLPDLNQAAKTRELPASETEQQLMETVMTVLQTEALGVTDNFFDAGANSLDFVQIYNAIKSRWNLEVEIMELFRLADVRGIAELIDAKINEEQRFEEGEL